MNSTDDTSNLALDFLSTLKRTETALHALDSPQGRILLSSFHSLGFKEQGQIIGLLWSLSIECTTLLKRFCADQSRRYSKMDSMISASSSDLGE